MTTLTGPPSSTTARDSRSRHSRCSPARIAGWVITGYVTVSLAFDSVTHLAGVTGSAVVELNRAVALAMVHGPEVGLQLVDQIAAFPHLAGYHLLPSVRGDLLARLGRDREAADEFHRAASLAGNDRERALLTRRARAVPGSDDA